MRVAILSESPADEAAVRILVEAVLARRIEVVPIRRRAPGIHGVLATVGPVLRSLHYQRTADGLVVVVDSNSSPIHARPLGERCPDAVDCRLCGVRRLVAQVQASLTPMRGLPPILTAVGLAVPVIEAWYLCGRQAGVSENAWVQGMREGHPPYTKNRLKTLVYGTDRPPLALETQRAAEHMGEVAGDLDLLEREFPVGFGALRSDLRGWGNRNTGL